MNYDSGGTPPRRVAPSGSEAVTRTIENRIDATSPPMHQDGELIQAPHTPAEELERLRRLNRERQKRFRDRHRKVKRAIA